MIEFNTLNTIGVSVIGVMIAFWYSPIQPVKEWLINTVGYFSSYMGVLLSTILNCSKCSGFFIGMVFFLDFPAAALTAFSAYVIGHLIDRIESYYE